MLMKGCSVLYKSIGSARAFHSSRIGLNLAIKGYDNESITLRIDNETVNFTNVFLRDACDSPASVDPNHKQKKLSTAQIATGLKMEEEPRVVKKGDEEALRILWSQPNSTHESVYTKDFLLKYSNKANIRSSIFFDKDQVPWDRVNVSKLPDVLEVGYDSYFAQEGFSKVLANLNRYGISFVSNIPDPTLNTKTQELSKSNVGDWPVAKLARKFGYIKETFYGTLFDVKNKDEAENIAYTDTFLPLHMDLLYYESPPGLQFLHFIKNSTEGGESIFADAFAIARKVKERDPEAYDALKKVPITYRYENNGEFYYYKRPLVVEETSWETLDYASGIIKEVNYSPPFQGHFEFGIHGDKPKENSLFKLFTRGYLLFESLANQDQNQLSLKVPEGMCVVFDNRRILHSRKSFSSSNGGQRWLMGCYVDGDSFRSRLRTNN